ncbi:3044_t:CDS:2 [Funneliformis geosporum]|nr:3044_t:CDS:2 [Funneliformis geosporum]
MNHQWRRFQPSFVALKCLNNSQNITFDFINEITIHNYLIEEDNIQIVRCYGITQEPISKNYVIVMNCAEYRSLRNYLSIHLDYEKFWSNKIHHLKEIANGLENIHEKNFIHRDLHIGNVVKFITYTAITDMGLCKPADYKENKSTKNSVYGVLPYTAPEILRGQHYTQSSDIYSFGMIMYEVVSGFPPYYDTAHDESLALNICQGLRPRFHIKVPQLILHLNKRCLDADPLNRPKASEIREILTQWERQKSLQINSFQLKTNE